MNKKKGIFLIYVLFTAVLLSVFLLTAVGEMHNSFFLTRRFTGENKAHWAAEAGIQYCEFKLKQNLSWPFLNNTDSLNETFGEYKIESRKHGKDGYYIHGISTDEDEEFHIYFSKKNTKTSSGLNIVPENFPSSELRYCSYNSFNEDYISHTYETKDTYQEDEEEYNNVEMAVGNNHIASISSPGVYIISDGRSRIYESVIEKMLVVDNNNRMGGGLYAGGNIDIGICGRNSKFQISQTSNKKPEVYCKKNMNIMKSNDATTDTDYNFPIYTKLNGTIYYGKDFNIRDTYAEDNSFSNKNINPGLARRKYGLNLKEYTSAKDDLFPKLEWSKIQEMVTQVENKVDKKGDHVLEPIESGSYVAIYEKETDGYTLCRLNRNYLDRDGTPRKSENLIGKTLLEEDVLKAEEDRIAEIKRINDSHQEPEYGTDANGNSVITGYHLSAEGARLIKLKKTDRGLIEEFIKNINHLETDDKARDDILCASTKGKNSDSIAVGKENSEQGLKANINFKIETVTLSNAKPTSSSQETNKTPIITLKKSVKTKSKNITNEDDDNEYFNLFTLTKKESGYDYETNQPKYEFNIDETKSTDLVFAEKNNGLSERHLLLNSEENDEDNELSLLANSNSNLLYTNGYISINGKLSGTGQIISKGSVYFKAGSQLYAGTESSNSKLAIYSKGTVQMGIPEGKKIDTTQLYKRIQEAMSGETAYYTSTIVSNVFYKQIEITEDDKKYSGQVTSNVNNSGKISLSDYMQKYYGFTYREARDYIEDVVIMNANWNYKLNRYVMPSGDEIKMTISYKSPSGFSGIIYACGGFKTNANYGDLTINGVLVSYGASPSANHEPGSGKGLDSKDLLNIKTPGGIEIEKCKNFSIIYNSTDLNNFIKLCNEKNPINLSCVYYNKL